MPEETADKKTRQGISLSPELLASAKVKAGANLSAYVRSLIERDLTGTTSTPEATGENVLVELCERLRPESAEMLGEWLASQGVNQPRLLGKLLDALADSLMRDINNKVTYGDAPLVLVKLLREDAHADQAIVKSKNLPLKS